jgi:magnesium transporter
MRFILEEQITEAVLRTLKFEPDGRIVAYTDQYACEWSGGALKPRLAGLRQDIHSLIDYEEQLANKVQFVLDALVGLTGIAQNDVFKVLTIVSMSASHRS